MAPLMGRGACGALNAAADFADDADLSGYRRWGVDADGDVGKCGRRWRGWRRSERLPPLREGKVVGGRASRC